MEVNKILEFIESFKDLGLVRFVAGFYREGTFAPVFGWIDRVSEGVPGQSAVTLLIWAVVLVSVVFAVDQIFYFTAPGRLDEWRYRLGYIGGVVQKKTPGKKK